MKSFDLVEPATLEEAVGLLDPDDPGVRAVAGATSSRQWHGSGSPVPPAGA